jgi:hypothetical protein
MKSTDVKTEKSDIENIKKYLLKNGFVCDSNPSAQQLIYSKNRDVIIIRNNKK